MLICTINVKYLIENILDQFSLLIFLFGATNGATPETK